jgi:tetratricopeptide (TPR) repeat protein
MLWIAALALAFQPDPAMLRRLFEEGLAKREREYGLADARTAAAARALGLFLRDQHDRTGAHRALAEALSIDEKTLGESGVQTSVDTADLASVSTGAEAEALWQRAARSNDFATASRALSSLGEIHEAMGDLVAAAGFYRAAVAKEEAASGKDGARVAVRLNSLALVSDPSAAIPLLQRALAIDRRTWGERHPETATVEANLSGELLAAGRVAESVRMGTMALDSFNATLGRDHPRTAAAASNLADALRAKGDRTGAERLYRRALSIDERAYGPNHPETLDDVRNLADFLREIGRNQEAAQLERRIRDAR